MVTRLLEVKRRRAGDEGREDIRNPDGWGLVDHGRESGLPMKME